MRCSYDLPHSSKPIDQVILMTERSNKKVLVGALLIAVTVVAIIVCLILWKGSEPHSLSDGVHEDFLISCVDTGETVTETMGPNEHGVSAEMTLKVFTCTAKSQHDSTVHQLNLTLADAALIYATWDYCDQKGQVLSANIVVDSGAHDSVPKPHTCVDLQPAQSGPD